MNKRRILAIACGLTLGTLAAGWMSDARVHAEPAPVAMQEAGPAVPADVKALFDRAAAAYQKIQTLTVKGSMTSDVDVMGQQQNENQTFTASFQAPNKFRQESEQMGLVVSDGKTVYQYNPQMKAYQKIALPEGKLTQENLPPQVKAALSMNPPLMMALTGQADFSDLPPGVTLSRADGQTIDGKTFDVVTAEGQGIVMKVLFDPQTHLVAGMRADMSEMMRQSGMTDVKKAEMRLSFEEQTPGAAVDASQFNFTPPADAKEMSADAGMGDDGTAMAAEPEEPSQALVDEPAPAFSLETPDGKTVSLADHKGKVVVLDFWASWCPPCREGLPHLDKLAKKHADGLVVLAVNIQETNEKATGFMQQAGLSLPVLMDRQGEVAQKYKVSGIPQTVVIGKDGTVLEVFVGYSPEIGEQVDAVVEEALKE